MSVNPEDVTSPINRLSEHHVLQTCKAWSLAVGMFEGRRVLLIRWNGETEGDLGNPTSHGRPTWFVLPDEFHAACLTLAGEPFRTMGRDWLGGGEWVY